ncbi:hypothetical protein RIF29_41153 [Crotalaria pallida]|uniref:Reverse transcriptase zinc-binding domain-containing protein n=1 Tax=Crotalaria pallida TaxID=3830 RepID=A0AAN9E560_CROPI
MAKEGLHEPNEASQKQNDGEEEEMGPGYMASSVEESEHTAQNEQDKDMVLYNGGRDTENRTIESEAREMYIENLHPKQEEKDTWRWRFDSGGYSVQSAYQAIQQEQVQGGDEFYRKFWANLVPSKVQGFAWKAIWNGIPTKTNLQRRRIIAEEEDTKCVFCDEEEESVTKQNPYSLITLWLC